MCIALKYDKKLSFKVTYTTLKLGLWFYSEKDTDVLDGHI